MAGDQQRRAVRRRRLLGVIASAGLVGCAGQSSRSATDSPTATDARTETPTRSPTASPRSTSESRTTEGDPSTESPTEEPTSEPTPTLQGDVAIRWTDHIEGTVYSSPAIGQASVFVGTDAGAVHAFDRATGTRNWTRQTDGGAGNSPVVARDSVYVTTTGGAVHAFDRSSGTQRWSVRPNTDRPDEFYASPAVGGGTVYASTEDGTLLALSTEDGTRQWSASVYTTVDGYVDHVHVGDKQVFVTTDEIGSLEVRRRDTGELRWRLEGAIVTSRPVTTSEQLLIGTTEGILALNPSDGSKRWKIETNSPVYAVSTVVDGTMYATTSEAVYAIDLGGRAVRWQQRYDDMEIDSLAADRDRGYAGGRSGTVVAFDSNTGTRHWSGALSGRVVVTADSPEFVVAATETGGLYALTTS